ncbi:YciI family protein [Rathayibacter sp. CAU 1779]|uniref:YciI family protein n=1 Tax=Planctomonas sp. JC2975 TaxID=2729626 RepID=UPI0014763A1C|nr:YciI family protein [Planctomonas sp. JC2975]NNC12177.1 hypothetical protein [Planctomonas sp. JC2975]
MKYMMIVATDPNAEPYSAEEDNIQEWGDFVSKKGAWIDGSRLRPSEDAKTVRLRQGELSVTDGPFLETKEMIAGYDVLECESVEDAVEIASKHPMARFGQIEVRPFWPFE